MIVREVDRGAVEDLGAAGARPAEGREARSPPSVRATFPDGLAVDAEGGLWATSIVSA